MPFGQDGVRASCSDPDAEASYGELAAGYAPLDASLARGSVAGVAPGREEVYGIQDQRRRSRNGDAAHR